VSRPPDQNLNTITNATARAAKAAGHSRITIS